MTIAPAVVEAGAVPTPKARRRPAAMAVVAALWLAFLVAHLLLSGRVWWWRPADLLPPAAFVAVPALIALAAAPSRRARRPAAILAAGALAIGASLAGFTIRPPWAGPPDAPPDALRVVSWNTEYWYGPGEDKTFFDLLRAQRADVYLLQEYLRYPDDTPTRVDDVDRLRAELPGYQVATAGELITLSRYPIVASRPVAAPDAPPPPADAAFADFWRYKTLRTDLRIGDRVLSVYNVHLPTPVWIGGASPLRAAFWTTIRRLHAQRGPHLRALDRDVAANDLPVLMAGDLNTTSAMGERQRLPAGLRDAAGAAPSPVSHPVSYPVSWPVGAGFPTWWRLDWAFVSAAVAVHDYELRAPAGLSDHRIQYLAVSL